MKGGRVSRQAGYAYGRYHLAQTQLTIFETAMLRQTATQVSARWRDLRSTVKR